MKTIKQADSNLFIGIDLGTTHIKSAVFDDLGTLLELRKEPTPLSRDEYGQIYEPLVFYNIVKEQLKIWLDKYPYIKGISITGMAEAGLIVDRCVNKELTPILPWFDQRTMELSMEISSEAEVDNFYKTGLHNSYKFGIYKYIWLLEHYGLEKENTIWLSVSDYIGWKLTGEYSSEPTFAARTYVYDIRKQSWDTMRLGHYGLTEQNFPVIRPSGEKIGYLSDQDMLFQPYQEKIPVAIAGHDHVCAAYAVLDKDSNSICNSIGTAETFLGLTKEFKERVESFGSGLVYGPFLNTEEYFWMANIPSSGQSIEWFCKNIQVNAIDYDRMNELVQSLPDGPTGIIYFPFLSGIGTPYFRSDVGGAIFGIRSLHGTKDFIKAMMEGINYHGKWILSLVPDMDIAKVKDFICVGGAADSAPWMQIKSNILGLPVSVPQIKEATLLGAVAVMLDQKYGTEVKQKFMLESRSHAHLYQAEQSIMKQYEELYKKKYTFLIDMILL